MLIELHQAIGPLSNQTVVFTFCYHTRKAFNQYSLIAHIAAPELLSALQQKGLANARQLLLAIVLLELWPCVSVPRTIIGRTSEL